MTSSFLTKDWMILLRSFWASIWLFDGLDFYIFLNVSFCKFAPTRSAMTDFGMERLRWQTQGLPRVRLAVILFDACHIACGNRGAKSLKSGANVFYYFWISSFHSQTILIIFSFLPESGKSTIVQALTKQLNALYLRRAPMIIILGELATPAPGTQFLASWTLKVDTTYMATTRLSEHKTNCFPDWASI